MDSKKVRKMKSYLRCNSATILTCVGSFGVIATTISAAKATPKAIRLLENAEKEKEEKLTKFEALKVACPVYFPTVLLACSTIVCIFGANVINKRTQASLTSAYALLNESYEKYKSKVAEMYGDDADTKIRNSIAIDKAKQEKQMVFYGEELMFYDEYSDRFFYRTMDEVRYAEYHFNRNFALRGYATLNEFYDFLGLPHIDGGDSLGWSIEMGEMFYGYSWIDFNHILVEDPEGDPDYPTFYKIEMPFKPALNCDMF